MWERTLKDLIRGLRAHKHDESKFIAQAIDEIRQEVKSKDMELKTAAILKLTYLEMLGYDMGWASFNILEVMSSQRFHHKAVGYLAAGQSFHKDTDVLMLTTNLLKKDLTSTPLETAVTLNGLAQFVTPDLGRDLSHEIITMLTHSRAAIRKRAILVLYKIITVQPDVLQSSFSRLRDKLEDPDPGVVGATVSVLCELVRQKEPGPQMFLPLAPQLFHILTKSTNNWMLIKVIKLFGWLAPHEPRLIKKLQPPITDLINTTPAISLLYECVRTCIIGQMFSVNAGNALAKTCVRKLATFLEDSDQNLRYIALLALVKIVPSHPHLLAEYQTTILASVDDPDISIRMRALDVVSEMVTEDNIQTIVQHLLSHLAPSDTRTSSSSAVQSLQRTLAPSTDTLAAAAPQAPGLSRAYRLVLAQRILAILQHATYARIPDFAWLLSVLVDLAYVARAPVGAALRDALVDVCLRVRAVRAYATTLMTRVLADAGSFVGDADADADACAEVLWAAAWIVGEYKVEQRDAPRVLGHLLQEAVVKHLSPETQAVFLQSAMKVFGHFAAELSGEWNDEAHLELARRVCGEVIQGVEPFASSEDVEVQERAANILALFAFVRADLSAHQPSRTSTRSIAPDEYDPDAHAFADPEPAHTPSMDFPKSLMLLYPLFSSPELGAVAPSAQAAVPVPPGLDLNAWIVSPPAPPLRPAVEVEDGEGGDRVRKNGKAKDKDGTKRKKKRRDVPGAAPEPPVETAEERAERERVKAERLERMRDDPYYLFDDRPKRTASGSAAAAVDVDSIPVVKLEFALPPLRQTTPVPSIRASDVVVDRTGRLPSQPQRSNSSPAPLPAPAADVEEEATTNLEPIKVVRAKKKKAGSSKKKTLES
ncbi:Adaptor protein complex AP-3 delta subunit [Auricularia subglabra TFB-10046 SS5]|nr:Adaptor protein complex AP-3 delta subunit [Auricularia subglabra TFB-10046 SS5]